MPSDHLTEIQEQLARLPPGLSLAVALTGGGSWIAPALAARVGASANLCEIVIPYSRESLAEYLGVDEVTRACCQQTARMMAETAQRRASLCSPGSEMSVGMGLTCILPSAQPDVACVAHLALVGEHSISDSFEIDPEFDRGEAEKWVAQRCLARLCRLYCPA